jgi:carbonic anhydrase/acetyltransferase-like protein (isoleucine patch superfamily)
MPIYAIDNLVPQIHTDTYISSESTVIGNVIVKAGASIWPQAVLRGDCDTITLEESSFRMVPFFMQITGFP